MIGSIGIITVLILFTALLPFLFLLILGYKIIQKRLVENAIARCKQATCDLVPRIEVEGYNRDVASSIWLEVLLERELVPIFRRKGSFLIYGTPEMGLNNVLRWGVHQVNSNYSTTKRVAIYVDLMHVAQPYSGLDYASPEDVYRSIILKLVKPLLSNMKMIVGEKEFKRAGLENLYNHIQSSVHVSLHQISFANIRNTLYEIWQILGISSVKVILNNIKVIDPNSMPFLLGSIMRTFGRTGVMDLIVCGEQESIKLLDNTSDGFVGIQLGHDTTVGLDLESILMPEQSEMRLLVMTENDPRVDFLDRILSNIIPYKYGLIELFSPPDIWNELFIANNGDIEKIAHNLGDVVEIYHQTSKKITRKSLMEICGMGNHV